VPVALLPRFPSLLALRCIVLLFVVILRIPCCNYFCKQTQLCFFAKGI